MSDERQILLVGADAGTQEVFARATAAVPGATLRTASRIGDALEVAHETRPLLIVSRHLRGSHNAWDDCRKVKADGDLSAVTFCVTTDPSHIEWDRAFGAGVEAVLPWPLTGPDLARALKAAQRVRRIRAEIAAGIALNAAPAPVLALGETWLAPLVRLLDEVTPGSRVRGEQVVEFAHHLAARFGIPAMWLRDLDRAGRFADAGVVYCPRQGSLGGGLEWHEAARSLGTYALLRSVDGLAGAAELTALVRENWNGSGFPHGLARTDIPLRCRILRVALDYVLALERGDPQPAQRIHDAAGSLYDPMVIDHFDALVWVARPARLPADHEMVPVAALRSGMTLAADVMTHTGLLLLHEGTVLTPQTIQQILRVHYIEPIRPGIVVRTLGAA